MPVQPPPGFFARPIAHRGLHDAARGVVENSRAAAERAVAAGYGLEIDVQASADGEAIVLHDATLERLTDAAGPVSAHRAAEIARLRLIGSATHESPPLLTEILDVVAGRAPLVIEVKDVGDARLEARVAALLADYAGPAVVMSFSPASVARLAAAAPDVPRGLVAGVFEALTEPSERAALADLDAFDAVGASFASYRWSDLPRPEVARRRAGGVPILSWTICSPAEAVAALRRSDQITFEGFNP